MSIPPYILTIKTRKTYFRILVCSKKIIIYESDKIKIIGELPIKMHSECKDDNVYSVENISRNALDFLKL